MIKTGTLRRIGLRNLGMAQYEYSECVDCHSLYPHARSTKMARPVYAAPARIVGYPVCNGSPLSLCPCCRPALTPNLN